MARHIKADGTEQEVKPKNGHAFTLQEMREYVDSVLEGMRLTERLHLYLDESGAEKGRPLNKVAHEIVFQHTGISKPICGDVLIADISEMGYEEQHDERAVSKMAHDIVVVAASAGGVEALRTLVAGLPAGLPASLFMVLHIPALLPSALPTILSCSGPLPARHATEGMKIEQGTMYVAPPDHHLVLKQGYVHLGTGPKKWRVRPAADMLFRSAASVYGARVVGVVLTGVGQDGTTGLHAVKQSGGVTVIQDPTEAAWPSMPQSALDQGVVDYTLPLVHLASLLIHLIEPSLSKLSE